VCFECGFVCWLGCCFVAMILCLGGVLRFFFVALRCGLWYCLLCGVMLFFVVVVRVCVVFWFLFPFAEGEVLLSGVFCECDVGVCLEVELFFFAAVG